ncbi:MAG: class I SAM-dependent methyltransferase, partial [Bullifex sp.]
MKKDFARILKNGALEAHRWMNQSDSEVSRIYDRNLDELPITVELYGKYARIVNYGDELSAEMKEEIRDIVSRMVYVESARIIFQERKKREDGEQHGIMADEAVVVDVKENSLTFRCDLTTHVDTGLFLDQVNTRLMVKNNCFGLKVLNLFSYTGSFSVYAAAGGAESVTSVDLSNTYTAVARENLRANGFLSEEKYPCITSDAGVFVKGAVEKDEKWDLIIFDPPSFSNSHKMVRPFDIRKDAYEWFDMLNKLLKQKGILIFSTNLATFSLDRKRLKRSFRITEITGEVLPQGFSRRKNGISRVYLFEKVRDVRESLRNDNVERVKDEDFERLIVSMERDAEQKSPSENRDRKDKERRGGYQERGRREGSGRPSGRFSDDKRHSGRDGRRSDKESSYSSRRDDRPRFDSSRDSSRREGRSRYDSYRDERPRFDRDSRPRYEMDERREGRYDDRRTPRYDERPRGEGRSYDRPRHDSYRDSGRYDERPRFDRDSRPRYDRDDRRE